MLVGTDNTAIDEMDSPIELAFSIGLALNGAQYLLP